MSVTRLKSVSLKEAVMFNGSAQGQISAQYGCRLELGSSSQFVTLCPPPGSPRDTVCVPMSNVKGFVVIDEEAEAARQLEAEIVAEAKKTATLARAKAPKTKGVEKFVKNPDTGIIESVLV